MLHDIAGCAAAMTNTEAARIRTREVIHAVLAAIESRDLIMIESRLAGGVTWQNVPNAPATGRDEVMMMFDRILPLCDDVKWDVVSETYEGNRGWLERVDRFLIDGEWHEVLCNGVFEVDADAGLLVSVRDYVDLGEWRARILPVYARRAAQRGVAVVERHIAAVRRRDVVAMAADYASNAVLVRDGVEHRGRRAIADYFGTVPGRLGSAALELTAPDEELHVGWSIVDGGTTVASGTDAYEVVDGRIVRQIVHLDGEDF